MIDQCSEKGFLRSTVIIRDLLRNTALLRLFSDQFYAVYMCEYANKLQVQLRKRLVFIY